MTEPKRWTAYETDAVTPVGVVAAADFDRLRDERDSWRRTAERLETEKVEARRVAGVLADALRNNAPCYCDHPLRAGLPPCSRCSALAVFDTLTEGEDR